MVTVVMCRFGWTFLVSFAGFGKIARSSKDSCFDNLNGQPDRHKTSVLTCTYSAGALIRRVCKFSVCKFASASSGKENENILDAVLRKTKHEMNTNVTKAKCSVFELLYTFYLFIWRLLFKKLIHL